jgi:hypothetical protein
MMILLHRPSRPFFHILRKLHFTSEKAPSTTGEKLISQKTPVFPQYIIILAPEMAKLGKSFVRLAMECIWVWSKWFPIDPDSLQMSAFKVSVEKLT